MYSKNPAHHSTMKHLERELYWIRENVQQGTIILEATYTEDQCADMLTKASILEEVTNVTVGGSIKHSTLTKEQQPHK